MLAIAWSLYRFPETHKGFLLLASYVFYGFWNWSYLPLLFGISLVAVLWPSVFSEQIGKGKKALAHRGIAFAWLRWVTINIRLSSDQPAGAIGSFAHPPRIKVYSPLLPLGISFFVFHAISLLMDCYRGKLERAGQAWRYAAVRRILSATDRRADFACLAFPASTARVRRNPNHIHVNRALLLIVGGLFKKVVISNMLATRLVEPVFAVPQSFGAGYAAGRVRLRGADLLRFLRLHRHRHRLRAAARLPLPANFNAPYKATSPQEFWRRWHISLSTWLRDYLYIPLGGSRKGGCATYLNLMITMLLGGLWHGAAWTFVAWGGLHGGYLVVHRLWTRHQVACLLRWRATEAWKWAARILLFHAVCAGWVFFAVLSFELAFPVFGRLEVRPGLPPWPPRPSCWCCFSGWRTVHAAALAQLALKLSSAAGPPSPAAHRGRGHCHDRNSGANRRSALHLLPVLASHAKPDG